jgi:hypothetical protein
LLIKRNVKGVVKVLKLAARTDAPYSNRIRNLAPTLVIAIDDLACKPKFQRALARNAER